MPGISSSRLIVLVEVVRVDEVGLSGKVVLVFLVIEVSAVMRVLESRRVLGCAIKVDSKVWR
jgi:hypothetical protein